MLGWSRPRPKGVEITFNNLGFTNDGIAKGFNLGPKDRLLSYLPLAHSFERMAVENLSIYTAAELYFARDLDTLSDREMLSLAVLLGGCLFFWLGGRFNEQPRAQHSPA